MKGKRSHMNQSINSFHFITYAILFCKPRTSKQASVPQISDPSKIKIEFLKGQPKYMSRLQQIEALLLLGDSVSIDEVEQLLGHGVLAGKVHINR